MKSRITTILAMATCFLIMFFPVNPSRFKDGKSGV